MSKIAILFNQVSDSHDRSDLDVLTQSREISQSLVRGGHEPTLVPCTLDWGAVQTELRRVNPDIVFNLVESLGGTDRLMAAATLLLDAMQLPYTGANTLAILRSGDKMQAKLAMASAGIPTPAWFNGETETWWPSRGHGCRPSFPSLIVKSVHEHASFEIDDDSVLSYRDDGQVQQALVERLQKTGRVHMAEQFVSGREFNLSLLELDGSPLVLAPAEIDFCGLPDDLPQIVGANAKWNEDSVEYQQTPRRFDFTTSDSGLIAELSGLALECWNLFDLAGYARVDFRVDEGGRPYVLEVNANPCLSQDAGFVAAAKESRFDYDQVIEFIVSAHH